MGIEHVLHGGERGREEGALPALGCFAGTWVEGDATEMGIGEQFWGKEREFDSVHILLASSS